MGWGAAIAAFFRFLLGLIGIYEKGEPARKEKAEDEKNQAIRKAAATGDVDTLSIDIDKLRRLQRKKRGLLGGNKSRG